MNTKNVLRRHERGIYVRGNLDPEDNRVIEDEARRFVVDLTFKGTDGRWHRRRETFSSLTSARKARRDLENRKDDKVKFDAGRVRLGEFINDMWMPWLVRQTEPDVPKKDRRAPLTVKRYKGVVRKYIVSPVEVKPRGSLVLSEFRLEDLSPDVIFAWKEALPPSVASYALTALSSALEHAVKDLRILQINPVRQIRRPRRVEKRKPRVLSPTERARLLDEARGPDGKPTVMGAAVALGLEAGLRMGETLEVLWSDIDFDNAVLHVSHQRWNEDPKDHSVRDVPLGGAAMARLRAWRRVQAEQCLSRHVISGKAGRPMSASDFLRRFRALSHDEFTYHAFRHSFTSDLAHAGVDPWTICSLLGHRDPSMIFKVYGHATTDSRREAIRRLAEHRQG